MTFLVFQLQGLFSSWGTTAVGEYRGSYEYPSESALIGLLAAALGARREDEAAHAALRDGYDFVVGVQAFGKLLRDYHTAQVPGRAALKGRPRVTRRDELNLPKDELNTILSTRDYRQGASSLIAVHARESAPHDLEKLAAALREPRFVLYLGRKSCPPAAPVWPQVIESDDPNAAFEEYRARFEAGRERCRPASCDAPLESIAPVVQLAWGDGLEVGVQPDFSTLRRDRVIRRRGWQFSDRVEYVKILREGN
jgi:CRISPR system Cascade subunit CasD